ncbi:hypothetical protein [Sphingobacterium sp. E70]|uniref:hypothetical protein n=1 Tax=Sphingobacterium sp. E70 TaxID=2853439 RepID=UPI0027957583|nr:hypothetical protein [Sphingobacterium sp. E70]
MPNKTLNNLSIGIGLSLFVLLVSSTASYLGIKEQNKHRRELTATRKIISLSNIILNSLQGLKRETGAICSQERELPGAIQPSFREPAD